MTDAPEPSIPAGAAPDWARPMIDRQLKTLGELAELGLEVARAVERRVKAAEPEDDINALALAYARVARAVRQTIMLQSKLMGDVQAQAGDPARQARLERAKDQAAREGLIERILDRTIREQEHDTDAAEALLEEAMERLDGDDIYGAVLGRPVSEIIADICRDLGLSPDWPRLAEQAWARDEMASGQVGVPLSPYLPIASSPADGGGGGPLKGVEVANGIAALRPLSPFGTTPPPTAGEHASIHHPPPS